MGRQSVQRVDSSTQYGVDALEYIIPSSSLVLSNLVVSSSKVRYLAWWHITECTEHFMGIILKH